nr:immunoglobulin light chain junction region [Macaca mulatta]MOX80125.1 immunoglobulin light chain junction region [Macaca mulatta]MOX80234.1 immunoglobulin light chain junction region [Macaca mulatta]MOX81368.1 immunoglobulin light chain junction region [Macaca mulatta]MOX84026.1 immunoglobulin light chain junction region [Macaca mulatta]
DYYCQVYDVSAVLF